MTGGCLRTPPNSSYFLYKDLLSLKSQCPTFRKLTASRSTGPAALEQRHSATVALEMIGCGSRLVGNEIWRFTGTSGGSLASTFQDKKYSK